MATVTQTGTANGIIKYTGDYEMYVPKSMLGYFKPVETTIIALGCGIYSAEWVFDNETQRDAAITTLLSWY